MAIIISNAAGPETKPTRQWDAWTREEEESFFGALRQVGKNFEKITSRVQSKNKDQVLWTSLAVLQPEQHKAPVRVRHYYYRVIKRMNRILAPTLILDAKNSTYVHSAMLRWWSLLEKHNCSASKLRSKPRRFKAFVTALEHQLLKDHKKVKAKKTTPASTSSKKQASHADSGNSSPNGLPELVTSGSGDDSQNGLATGAGRKTSSKRKAGINGPQKSGSKGEAKRPPRPRKKATDGNLSKAAYAKWEKEASVGVSLMAEAAEQLERASAANPAVSALEGSGIQSTRSTGGNVVDVDVQTGGIPAGPSEALSAFGLAENVVKRPQCRLPSVDFLQASIPLEPRVRLSKPQAASPSSALSNAHDIGPREPASLESCTAGKSISLDATRCNNCSTLRTSSTEEDKLDLMSSKLKLQLFPFDDSVRKALEQDGLNPHLELTLKARKSMSSVLHHLVQKWGRCTVASGELRLFPYPTQWSNVPSCQSWSLKDVNVSAADVHVALGKPSIFRLRYAWLESRVLESTAECQHQQCPQSGGNVGPEVSDDFSCAAALRSSSINAFMPNYLSTSQMAAIQAPVPATEPYKETQISIVPFDKRGLDQTSYSRCPASSLPISKADRHVGHKAVESPKKSRAFPVTQSEPLQAPKPTSSNAAAGTRAMSKTSKEHTVAGHRFPIFADREMEGADKPTWKEPETGSQISGCAWLYESNDGFAQQLWSQEDTLPNNGGHSVAQMDWVDGLTNISVGELLGEASRAGFATPLDCLQPSSGQVPLPPLDSFDIPVAGQDLSTSNLMPVGQSCPIWDGDDTCDAFSFQRLDRGNKDAITAFGDEQVTNSFGLDVTFADFRNLTCLKEGESLVGFDAVLQPQFCRNSDLFDGDTSVGLGGLIEALSQGSLDGFQTCIVNQCSPEREKDRGKRICQVPGESQVTTGDPENDLLCSKDETSQAALTEFCEQQGRLNGLSSESIDAYVPSVTVQMCQVSPFDADVPNVTVPSFDAETQRLKSSHPKISRKKEMHSPRKSFKLPRQYSTVRSLKLQG